MKIGKVSVTTFSWLERDKHLHWCFHAPFDKDKECVSKRNSITVTLSIQKGKSLYSFQVNGCLDLL